LMIRVAMDFWLLKSSSVIPDVTSIAMATSMVTKQSKIQQKINCLLLQVMLW
jgi:hypothetical protein